MRHGLFITGTDTNIGKTVVSAAALVRYRDDVHPRYWKPIQTGTDQDDDTAEVMRLSTASEAEILRRGVRLPQPVSPHLAARLNGRVIRIEDIAAIAAASECGMPWIIEGAGGALVPLNETELMTDLIGALGLAALVVARSTLGTINHTLLTIDALRARSIAIAGVVMVGPENADNRDAIAHFGHVPVVGEMPRVDPLTPLAVATWARTSFDTGGRLREYFA